MSIARAKFQSPMEASADYLGNGAIEINKYESEIVDLVRRGSPFLNRVDRTPATGHPHRYFEQTAIATASFTDPRAIASTASGPTRVERPAMIKAVTAQTNVSLFDVDVTRQQGQFAMVEAKDIQDITSAVLVTEASAVWNGNDTSLVAPTTPQYVGVLTQITNQGYIGLGASIVDGLKAEVASMVANPSYDVKPTAIYGNPMLLDLIDREAKASKFDMDKVEITAGVKVNAIMTQAGMLPLIPDPYLPATTDNSYGFAVPATGTKNYFAVIVTEKMIEMPYIHGGDGNPNPRLFQLGLVAGLQGQFVAIHFNCVIAKGAGYAHAVVAVNR